MGWRSPRISSTVHMLTSDDTVRVHVGTGVRFKEDGNLDLKIGKTGVLGKGPTVQHVFDRVKHFETDPNLQDIDQHFTRDMLP